MDDDDDDDGDVCIVQDRSLFWITAVSLVCWPILRICLYYNLTIYSSVATAFVRLKSVGVTLTNRTQTGCYKENLVQNMAYEVTDTPFTNPLYDVKGKKQCANGVTHVRRRWADVAYSRPNHKTTNRITTECDTDKERKICGGKYLRMELQNIRCLYHGLSNFFPCTTLSFV